MNPEDYNKFMERYKLMRMAAEGLRLFGPFFADTFTAAQIDNRFEALCQ